MSSPAERARADEPIGAFAIVAIGISLTLLVAGVVWPHMAGSLLRALVLALGLLYVGHRLAEADLPTARLLDEWTPFDGAAEPLTTALPAALLELEDELRFADDRVRSRRAVIPGSVRRTLREAWRQRLADRHGIEIGETSDLAQLPEGLAPPTLRFLLAMVDVDAPAAPHGAQPTTLHELDEILDDLEAM